MDSKAQLEEYEKVKQNLKKKIKEKTELEDSYDQLLQEIYNKETEYFSISASNKSNFSGNILRGFDGFARPHGHDSNSSFTNSDRIFSLSSSAYIKQMDPSQNQE